MHETSFDSTNYIGIDSSAFCVIFYLSCLCPHDFYLLVLQTVKCISDTISLDETLLR